VLLNFSWFLLRLIATDRQTQMNTQTHIDRATHINTDRQTDTDEHINTDRQTELHT